MVEKIIPTGNQSPQDIFLLKLSELEIQKLPFSQSIALQDVVKIIFSQIISTVEEEKIVYIDPSELIQKADLPKKKKNEVEIYISSKSDNAEGLKNGSILRNHFTHMKENSSLHGYVFYGKNESSPIACIYEIAINAEMEEYILLDKRLVDHPIAAWKVIQELKKKYMKLHNNSSHDPK